MNMTVRVVEDVPEFHVGRFVRHYLEMVVAMGLGMGLLHPVWMLATAGSAEGGVLHSTELMLLVMGTSMALPMAALMRYRRHGWPATLRMSAVMYLGLALPLPALWVGALGAGGVMVVGHVLMLALMLVEMLRHGEEYAGRHHEGVSLNSMACCAPPHGRSAALPSLVDGPTAASLRRLAEHPVDATLATAES